MKINSKEFWLACESQGEQEERTGFREPTSMTMNASMVLMSWSIFNSCKGISEHQKKVREIKQHYDRME